MYLKDFSQLIGKSVDSSDVQKLLTSSPFDSSSLADEAGAGIRFLSSRTGGIQLRLDEQGIVKIVFLYGRKSDGFSRFKEELALGVSSESGRSVFLEVFGPPAESGSDFPDFFSQNQGLWDRYDFDNASCHIQFSPDGGHFELITLRERTF